MSYDIIADIKGKFSAFVWDDPRQVLLTLAAAVESAMGGTSGAVSLNPSCPSILMIAMRMYMQIYNLFLSAGAAALDNPSQPFSWVMALAEGMKAIMK